MSRLKTERTYFFYKCGRCKGSIPYLGKRPDICPECGYSAKVHGLRDVNDVPGTVKLNLKNLNLTSAGSRGKLEQATITSR